MAVFEPIYGEEHIASQSPYRAKLLSNTVWRVEGSLPEGWIGGVPTAFIRKADGQILDVYHTR
jgi:hypothetical protein